MCGIVGLVDYAHKPIDREVFNKMRDLMVHRGPDDSDSVFLDNVALGHRRLSIIDLSPLGRQPMADDSKQIWITYNGEIYNFREIRKELEAKGYRFRSTSDTEVIVYSYKEWGAKCVDRFNGMFAFCIYDSRKKSLFIARDRYGIKPFYYFNGKGIFAFASEIKALLAHPEIESRLNPATLVEYLTYQNMFTDHTMFQDILLLPPGHTMTVSTLESLGKRQKYWDFNFSEGTNLKFSEACDKVAEVFDRSVSRQLVSDVPVGSYLSGGMDTGAITAIAARHIPRIHTFTCGFDLSSASGLELAFDERPAAEMMANLFKTEHYQVVLHAGDMENVMQQLIWHLDEPRVGQSYPNYYVSRLASKFVKVVLSGTGGDELFGGYPWRYYRLKGVTDRENFSREYYNYWQRLTPNDELQRALNPEYRTKVRDIDPFETFRHVLREFTGNISTPEEAINASLFFESKTFLHGLLLVEDKLSMASSLETRVPFLDNEIVDLASTLPAGYKLRDLARGVDVDEDVAGKLLFYRNDPNSDGKIILRDAMTRILPPDIIGRRKQGFSAPDASWFKGDSITYVRNILENPGSPIYQILNYDYYTDKLKEHCEGRRNNRLLIWSLICLDWWLRVFKPAI